MVDPRQSVDFTQPEVCRDAVKLLWLLRAAESHSNYLHLHSQVLLDFFHEYGIYPTLSCGLPGQWMGHNLLLFVGALGCSLTRQDTCMELLMQHMICFSLRQFG